jgi:hypothetical protein
MEERVHPVAAALADGKCGIQSSKGGRRKGVISPIVHSSGLFNCELRGCASDSDSVTVLLE